MKKLTKITSHILLFCCVFGGSVWAQRVEPISFAGFEQRLQKESDTLFVYNFWATWCAPCVKELPHFETLGKKYREKNVKVVLVSLDFPEQLERRVIPFVEKKDLKSEVLLLTDVHDPALSGVWIDKISSAWSGAIPATLMAQKQEGVYAFKEKEFTYEELEAWLLSFIDTQ